MTKTCFIIMPVSTPLEAADLYRDQDHFAHVLECLFLPAVEKAGFDPIPPTAEGDEVIHARIIQHLEGADVVLCDMTLLNANVFFELGIRTALDRPVALVKDDKTPRVPFDINLINHHRYEAALAPWKLEDEITRLAEHLAQCRDAESNSLWRYFGLTARGADTPRGTAEQKLELILQAVQPSQSDRVKLHKEEILRYASKWIPELGAGIGDTGITVYHKAPLDAAAKNRIIRYAARRGVPLDFEDHAGD